MQEFQVVILAGGDGRRLKPLTDGIPKSLLPVANRPLLAYQLDFVAQAGFKEVIVITSSSSEDLVSQHIAIIQQELEELKIQILVCEDFMGSAACLLKVKDRIKNHVIVMSGDVIVEDVFLHQMADLHRAKDAAVTVLVYREQEEAEQEKANKPDKNTVVDYIGIEPKENRLVFTTSSTDLENTEQQLKIRKSLLRRYPNFTLHMDLHDAHFYIFSKWTLDVLEENKQIIQSIKTHFIPFLVKFQIRKQKAQELKIPSFVSPQAYNMSSTLSDPTDRVRCFAWLLDPAVYCARVGSFASYMKVNREIATGEKAYIPLEPSGEGKNKYFMATTAQVSLNTQITSGSVVGDSTKIGARVAVKKSIIGKHCIIADNAKVLNSVIMNHVNIGDGAKIQNCIVGPNCYIDPQASLTDCQLGSGCRVPAGSTLTGKRISSESHL